MIYLRYFSKYGIEISNECVSQNMHKVRTLMMVDVTHIIQGYFNNVLTKAMMSWFTVSPSLLKPFLTQTDFKTSNNKTE